MDPIKWSETDARVWRIFVIFMTLAAMYMIYHLIRWMLLIVMISR